MIREMGMLETVRRVRDSVHGTIDLSALEDQVLAHVMFQRLRRIKQLAFLSYVFPCASHSRFEHSLGALHLASVAWERMRKNQMRLRDSTTRISDFAQREKEKEGAGAHGLLAPTFPLIEEVFGDAHIFQALRLASLMHDVGHPPFSHSGERFLPSWDEMLKGSSDAPDFIREYMEISVEKLRQKRRDPVQVRVRHEVYSLLIIDQIMRDIETDSPGLAGRLTSRDICSVITTDIEPAAGSPLLKANAYRLCHELIAAELDIDRMDYLIRDSRECGVVYGIFDSARILDSLSVFYNPTDNGLHLAVQFAGLAAFEDYLRARESMYLQVYFHKTGVSCEAALQFLTAELGGWHLPTDVEHYTAIDEHSIDAHLREAAKQRFGTSSAFAAFDNALGDLTQRRRLWKRVFEVTTSSKGDLAALERVQQMIAKQSIPLQKVSSSTSLTRLGPREENAPSRNDLRLIKKDQQRLPRVVPIEDFSSLVNEKKTVSIHRLYVPLGHAPNGELWHRVVQKLLLAETTEK